MLTITIDFEQLKSELKKSFKTGIDSIVRSFYQKEFKAGVGGVVRDMFVFWYPNLWRKISAEQLSSIFLNQLSSHWKRSVNNRVYNYVQYGIAPLSFIGFLLRVYRAMTPLYAEIRRGADITSGQGKMEYYKRVYLSGKWTPLVYTEAQLKAYTDSLRISTNQIFNLRDMIEGKHSYRLELYPPAIRFIFPSQVKYYSKYSHSVVGIFHYTGAKGWVKVIPREWLPLGEVVIQNSANEIEVYPQQNDPFFREVFTPCIDSWVREILDYLKKQAEKDIRSQDIKKEMKKKIEEVLRNYTLLSEEYIYRLADLICDATIQQIRKLFTELEELGKLLSNAKEIIRIILKIKEEYQ